MPVPAPVKEFVAGEAKPGAARLNEIVDKLNTLLRMAERSGPKAISGISERVVAFKIVEQIAGSYGYYTLKTFDGEFTARPDDGPLEEEQLGLLSGEPDAIGVNLLQVGGGGDPIEVDKIYFGMISGRVDDESSYAGLLLIAFAPGGAGLPPAQYQDMIYMMVTDNQVGARFLRSHRMETT